MWIRSKQSKQLALEHQELESLVLARTAELQKLSQRLLKVQDEERRRFARDLHDSTGQTLSALKMSILFMRQSCKEDPAKLALISDVEALADQALEEIRTISYLLHPPLLDEVALFRVLQESLTNVHRHSGASDAIVYFKREAETVVLEIRDFGKGISAERLRLLRRVSAEAGVGLAGMRERLHELNGHLEIESDGHGTSLRATVPLYAVARPVQFEDRSAPMEAAQA